MTDRDRFAASFVLLAAARYALGRQSAGVAIVTEHIAARLDDLLPAHRSQLAAEIHERVDAGTCGMWTDCRRWQRLAQRLEATE